MQDFDFLFVVAEIAVALTGFAGLVAVLGSHANLDGVSGKVHSSRLQVSLSISLMIAAFALLPYLPYRLGAEGDTVYQISASGFFCISSIIFLQYTRRQWLHLREMGVALPVSFIINTLVYICHLALLICCAVGAVAGEYYLLALFILIYISGAGFMRVFVSLAQGNTAEVLPCATAHYEISHHLDEGLSSSWKSDQRRAGRLHKV